MKDRRAAPANISRGRRAEALARRWLEAHGLTFVEANYRCAAGEIDLVMRDGQVTVFVEVRYRASNRFGEPVETIGPRKQRRLTLAASHYLQRVAPRGSRECRFDVVTLCGSAGQGGLRWLRNVLQ